MVSVTRRTRQKTPPSTTASVEDAVVAAMEKLLTQGSSFTSLSVENLAAAAGIGRSTFYTHFRDKGQLVQRLMQRVTIEIVAAAGRWFEAPEFATKQDLRAAVQGIADVYENHYAVMAAVVETSSYDADVKQLFGDMMAGLTAQSRFALQRLKAAGRSRPDLPVETADVLTWMVERAAHQLLHKRSAAKRTRIIDSLTEVIWSTFVNREPDD